MGHRYKSYTALQAEQKEGTDYSIQKRFTGSDLCLLAIHGGSIEPGTTEAADAIAGKQYTFYSFTGLKKSGNHLLHIASTRFDEPCAVQLVQQAQRTVSIHGMAGKRPEVHIGGLDTVTLRKLGEHLQQAGFFVVKAKEGLAGEHLSNITNRNQCKRGVQMELTAGLRRSFFRDGNWSYVNRTYTTRTLQRFVSACRRAL
jgi:phage replication-related protein YjqB (UPF0714/DUF867 family)